MPKLSAIANGSLVYVPTKGGGQAIGWKVDYNHYGKSEADVMITIGSLGVMNGIRGGYFNSMLDQAVMSFFYGLADVIVGSSVWISPPGGTFQTRPCFFPSGREVGGTSVSGSTVGTKLSAYLSTMTSSNVGVNECYVRDIVSGSSIFDGTGIYSNSKNSVEKCEFLSGGDQYFLRNATPYPILLLDGNCEVATSSGGGNHKGDCYRILEENQRSLVPDRVIFGQEVTPDA